MQPTIKNSTNTDSNHKSFVPKKALFIIFGLLLLAFLAFLPASRDEIFWKWTSFQGKIPAYSSYLQKWPNGRHAAEANARMDEYDWSDALDTKTLQGYERYVQLHSAGKHTEEARNKIELLQWQETVTKNTVLSFQSFLQTHPNSKFARDAEEKIKALRLDQSSYKSAILSNTLPALKKFLNEYPGHVNEKDVYQRIEKINNDIKKVYKITNDRLEINSFLEDGNTPLTFAISNNDTDLVKYLLEQGADVNQKTRQLDISNRPTVFRSPLEIAMQTRNSKEIVDLLLAHNIDGAFKNSVNGTYLHIAVQNEGNVDLEKVIPILIGKFGISVNEKGYYNGVSAVWLAKIKPAFDLLVKNGADLTFQNEEGENLLFAFKDIDINKYLLQTGLDVNKRNNNGMTPLFMAKSSKHIELLLSKGADPYLTDNKGNAPIFKIFDNNGDYNLLLQKGVDVNRSYGDKKLTLAHHLMEKIQEGVGNTKYKFRGSIQSLGKGLDAMVLIGNAWMEVSSRTNIHNATIAIGNMLSLHADFKQKDADGRTPFDHISYREIRELFQEYVNSFPLESPLPDYAMVLTMLATNLAPQGVDFEAIKRETVDEFLKNKIEECKKLPVSTTSWKDIQKQVEAMLN